MEKSLLIRPIGGFGDGKREEIGRNCTWLQDIATGQGFFYDAGVLIRRLEDQDRRKIDIFPSMSRLRECLERDGAHAQAIIASHAHLDHVGGIGRASNHILDGKPHNYKLSAVEEDMLIPAVMPATAFKFFLRVCRNNARQELLKKYDEDSDEYRRQFGRLVWNQLPYNLRDGYELSKEEQFVKDGTVINVGGFAITFYEVNHSVPNTFWILMEGYGKRVVFCSDFRLAGFRPEEDKTRETIRAIVAGGPVDYVIMDALYSSTPGFTGSEMPTVEEIERIAKDRLAKGKRVIITYHASNLRLMEELYKMAERLKKGPMAFVGRSMVNAAEISHLQSGPPDSSDIFSMTGCQAEGGDAPSALISRANMIDARFAVIIAAGVIPGNEEGVRDMVYQFDAQGAEVIMNNGEREHLAREGYEIPWYCHNVGMAHTHESGHEKRDGKREVAEAFIEANRVTGRKLIFTPYHGGKGDYEAFVQHVVPKVPNVEVKLLNNGDRFEI